MQKAGVTIGKASLSSADVFECVWKRLAEPQDSSSKLAAI
jgi:hypothetical protein